MTTDPNTTHTFGGIDAAAASTTQIPGWYKETAEARRGASVEFAHFDGVLDTLRRQFGVESVPAYYYDEDRDEYVQDKRLRVLRNPAWTGDGLDDSPQDTAAWGQATDEYTAMDARDAFEPLVEVASAAGYESAFGTVRTYRNGAEVQADILFDGLEFEDAEDDAEFVFGFETGYEYAKPGGSGSSVYASIIACNVTTGTILRGLTRRYSVSHRGDIEDVQDRLERHFADMFDRAEKVGETIYEVVAEARAYRVDLAAVPLSASEWYQALGFPADYADGAAKDLRNKRHPTAWQLHEAIAAQLTQKYDGKVSGSALTKHASNANELLYSPPAAESRALREAAEDLRGQGTLLGDPDQNAAEVLLEQAETLDDAVSAFQSTRERFRAMLEDMGAEDEDGDEAAGSDHERVAADGGEAQ